MDAIREVAPRIFFVLLMTLSSAASGSLWLVEWDPSRETSLAGSGERAEKSIWGLTYVAESKNV